MKSLTSKHKEVATFESDQEVIRTIRRHKFVVSRVPVPQFAKKNSKESVYQISSDPNLDLRMQSALFERAMLALGYSSKEVRKNIMVSGMAPRFMLAVSSQGCVLYNLDKGILVVDLTKTQLPDNWVP